MKAWYVALAVLLVLFSRTPLFAQSPAGPPLDDPIAQGGAGPEGLWAGPHAYGEEYGWHPFAYSGPPLDLSKEQITKMRDLWRRHFAATHDLRYDLMEKRVEMERLFTDPKADAAALMAKEKEIAMDRQQLMEQRVKTIIEWRSLLTPEQIQRLDRLNMAHHRMMGDMSFEMGRAMRYGMEPGMGYGMGPGMMEEPGMGPATKKGEKP